MINQFSGMTAQHGVKIYFQPAPLPKILTIENP